jgi:hypothetical protein
MQDPLFNLVQESPLDLNTLFGPAAQVEHQSGNGESGTTVQPEAIENAIAEPDLMHEMEEVVENSKESPEVNPGSLQDRIKKIEDE